MNKLAASLVLTLSLLFSAMVAGPAFADVPSTPPPSGECDEVPTLCTPAPESCLPTLCTPVPTPVECPTVAPSAAPTVAPTDRREVDALAAKVAKVQRLADRRAATIKRLRAKIRSLR